MTAGGGITHSERLERARREGGHMDGIQAWVALPDGAEEADPSFSHHGAGELPTFAQDGARGRLIAGELYGLKTNVRTLSPLFYLHWDLDAGGRAALPADYSERALYVARGAIRLGGERLEEGQMAVLAPGETASFVAEGPAMVMALGGEPVGERFIEWNFVSSSRDRIDQAKADWRAGRMKLPDVDNQEWIPLPPDPPPPPNPMS